MLSDIRGASIAQRGTQHHVRLITGPSGAFARESCPRKLCKPILASVKRKKDRCLGGKSVRIAQCICMLYNKTMRRRHSIVHIAEWKLIGEADFT